MTTSPVAHPPETLEGWYALHQIFRFTKDKATPTRLTRLAHSAIATIRPGGSGRTKAGRKSSGDTLGWSCFVRLIGSTSDLMAIHFRQTLDAIGSTQAAVTASALAKAATVTYSFLSVTEAGLYHITAELARAAEARGGQVGDAEYARTLAGRVKAERDSEHVRRRLYPERPATMPYVCFYPMSKRRDSGQNWYGLTLDERSRLMQAHGLTGRRYAGKIQQVITGAIGLAAWEWGVTLFAQDPIDFKKLVTDMRFDIVDAKYAEFGDYYVGKLLPH